MNQALVIRGHYKGQAFVPAEPMPQVEGTAELIVYPASSQLRVSSSIFDLFGKAPQLRSAEDIDAQVRAEKEAWGER